MSNTTKSNGFHNEAQVGAQYFSPKTQTSVQFTFENFFHPYIGQLIEALNQGTVADLLSLANRQDGEDFFTADYAVNPDNSRFVSTTNPPKKEMEWLFIQPHANYNWELCYHIPVAIAQHLSDNQCFAEAQRWFHYVFDPTSTDPINEPQRFWKFRPFRDNKDLDQIDALLALVSDPDQAGSVAVRHVLSGYSAILQNPFNPHVVARTRTIAYQYHVVMKYLDNLIAWGDSLFLQYTVETINEATQLYILAANILGERPQRVPAVGTTAAQSYDTLRAQPGYKTEIGNALVDLEAQFPFNLSLSGSGSSVSGDHANSFLGIGRTLYFCVPRNTQVLAYWDTVADRLFKIRHCLNIQGVRQPLPLFDPPIDPGMLVKAAAAGIDIGSIVNGLNQQIGPLRSLPLIQKALELAAEVRGLGGALLAALEKGDGEHLGLLRQGHEIGLQQMMLDTRFLQWKQAQEASESLLRTRASALERYRFYQRLLGLTPDSGLAPNTLPLDRRDLTEENFDAAYSALVGQYDKTITPQAYPALNIAGSASPGTQSGASGSGGLYLNRAESADLNLHTPLARDLRLAASTIEAIGGILALIPDFNVDAEFWGLGAHATVFGGTFLAAAARSQAAVVNIGAMIEEGRAAAAAKVAGYQRRADEWLLQNNLAARELMQIGRQVIASLIAEQVAHREYLTAQKQVAQSKQVLEALQSKFTGEELYGWMQGELFRLHQTCYRFALDVSRRAEQTMKQELMRPEVDSTDFVQLNHWDTGRKGLLSGDKLYQDVKRMEFAYHDNNRREYELTRHVSLRQLDPLALLTLRVTGECQVTVPEWLFDRDCPGHYLRRIRTLAVSVPSVVGPYTGINCKLTLLRSSVRTLASSAGTYARDETADDARFVDYVGSAQAIVTSSGTNDSGTFEKPDDRFQPFEGAGAISAWRIELPKEFRSFDYSTIADCVFHLRYTAREGGDDLAAKASDRVHQVVQDAKLSGLALLFSLRHDFPTEWAAFVASGGDFRATLRREHFPYLVQSPGANLKVETVELCGVKAGTMTRLSLSLPAGIDAALSQGSYELALQKKDAVGVLEPDATDVFMVLRYSV